MKSLSTLLICLFFNAMLSAGNTPASDSYGLIPRPGEIIHGSRPLPAMQQWTVAPSGAYQKARASLLYGLKQSGYTVKEKGTPRIRFTTLEDSALNALWKTHAKPGPEGYVLQLKVNNIVIGGSPRGVFYGVQTLLQLIHGTMPDHEITIIDEPDLALRGITDDISRGQVSTPQDMKTIIRYIASLKMNVYMPYLEDLFPFASHPDIGQHRGLYTVQQWRSIQSFADSLYVDVIPIFQTLGHYENLLILPPYLSLAEYPGAASLQIGREATYTFLKEVLDEIIPVFKSAYFHMGADESWDVGKSATRASAERNGLGSLHAWHYRKVYDIIRRHDKKVMMYGDIILKHPEILTEIPKDIILFDWHYYPRIFYPSVELFQKTGHPFIVSAGVHNWRRFFPNLTDAISNIHTLTRQGYAHGALGSITSNWGDYGGMNLRAFNYYGYGYAAAVSWNTSQTRPETFDRAFFPFFYGDSAAAYGAVYALLNDMSDRAEWLSMVAHPFYPLPKDKIKALRRAAALPREARQVHQLLNRVTPTRHRNHLDYLRLAADLYDWYGRLSQLKLDMYQLDHDQTSLLTSTPLNDTAGLAARARRLAGEIRSWNQRYARLWQRTNLPDNLTYMTDLWERVALYLDIKARELDRGNTAFNGKLNTAFISLPTDKPDQPVPHIFLRKTFNLRKIPEQARLQLISGSHARLYVNGYFIGEVLARKTLSARVESERVKVWDVRDKLRRGSNTIAIEVTNHTGKRAMANVRLDARQSHNWRLLVESDPYWLVSDRARDGWQKRDFNDRDWLNAVEEPVNWLISKPYPRHNLPSRIEFFSGYGH
ncbi:MAG: hypothetical protein D6677_03010 [Calditrichaeota bacterium]|nr:MAG: hypothetical protein D6677_03010 [Calditrichota bacterium]